VIVDGSFCCGTDIIKAIAVGAHLVGLGRMSVFCPRGGRRAAIVRMLELLEDEVQRSHRPACSRIDHGAKRAERPRLDIGPDRQ
jgi:hypothetical protein